MSIHQGFELKEVRKRVAVLEEVLRELAHPDSTGRSPDGGEAHPEKDIMSIRVEMKTWFKMKILLGEMDVESVKRIMPGSRPSEGFIQELEAFERKIHP